VQSTCSNPLAYFLVPLAGTGKAGRSHDFVMSQFRFALSQGWTCKAHAFLRGVNESAIMAGMAFAMPRQDSNLGTVAGRKAATVAAKSAPTAAAAAAAVAVDTAAKNKDMDGVIIAGQRLDALLAQFAADKAAAMTTKPAPKVRQRKAGKKEAELEAAKLAEFNAKPEAEKIAIMEASKEAARRSRRQA